MSAYRCQRLTSCRNARWYTVRFVIGMQEQAGIDIVSDGEWW